MARICGKERCDEPQCEGVRRVLFLGSSMYPTLRSGDELLIVPYPKGKRMRPGDVIAFRMEGFPHLVVHRIVSIRGKALKTRGDNNLRNDSLAVPRKTVLGRVTKARRAGRWRRLVHGSLGMAYSLLLLLRLYAIMGASRVSSRINQVAPRKVY